MRITAAIGRRPWLKYLLYGTGTVFVVLVGIATYFWISYGRMIDARLGGEQRAMPRIYARPLDLRAGMGLSAVQIVQRLNDIGYAERPKAALPGEFSTAGNAVVLVTRPAEGKGPRTIRADFARGTIARLTELADKPAPVDHVTLEAPLLAALAPGEKRRYVPIAAIPQLMIHAVLAAEDHRFFEHPGVDPIRAVAAMITNLRGTKPYLEGASTLTQQIVKNTFLTPEQTLRRKLQEQFMAIVLDARFTKRQILELYLNDIVLGQRGPFEIHGVAEAARIFFGKDVNNVTLAEAATIAGVIQSPSRLSPFRNPDRARDRRNVVLKEMADNGYVTKDAADKASREPLTIAARALENEAPFFVDYVSHTVDDAYADILKKHVAADVYTTLDPHLQRLAQEAVADGIAQVDRQIPAKRRKNGAEAALIAVDPRTGEILAFVGGRAYFQSQFDRVVAARRQPGSVFKPFVYLAAFERMAAEGRSDLTPATVEVDEPTTFKDGEHDYTPANYQNEYDGPITLRRALALSRNIVAVKVAEATGYDQVAELWKRVGVPSEARPYPAIALGSFEATPFDLATAYTLFANRGAVRPLTAVMRIVENGKVLASPRAEPRQVARPDTTFLVTNMMRSVLDGGTGSAARAAGFTLDAAGKTGTTNDLRDAWFIGFTPELLTAVWVGFDDNQPIGLSGAQAALPIWTTFMRRALAARPSIPFDVPEGVSFAAIDADNGKLATSECPHVIQESFLTGTEPRLVCDVHGRNAIAAFFSRLGRLFTGKN